MVGSRIPSSFLKYFSTKHFLSFLKQKYLGKHAHLKNLREPSQMNIRSGPPLEKSDNCVPEVLG